VAGERMAMEAVLARMRAPPQASSPTAAQTSSSTPARPSTTATPPALPRRGLEPPTQKEAPEVVMADVDEIEEFSDMEGL
jgi:hypothetical protein